MTDLDGLTLAEHGDSFEREWAAYVLDGFPAYAEVWRRHIVPLSFRAWQPDNQFIRPSLPPHLVGLADASYAVFYHVAHCHAWDQRLVFHGDPHDFPRPTECLYCFFAHAHSAHEALMHFCCAVNRVLAEYDRMEAFGVEYEGTGRRHPARLTSGVVVEEYDRLRSLLSAYRNLMIHEKPIFLQNEWLPRTGELDKYSGLTAIGEVARDPDCIRRDYRPVREALEEVLGLVKGVCEMGFAAGVVELDGLVGDEGYERDRGELGKDRKLTREKFERVRRR